MAIPAGRPRSRRCSARWPARAPVETHISAVFVGRDDAFKLKKAVALGFLDFTAAWRRASASAGRELALNRPNAPGLYRDVVPVTRGAGRRAGAGRRRARRWTGCCAWRRCRQAISSTRWRRAAGWTRRCSTHWPMRWPRCIAALRRWPGRGRAGARWRRCWRATCDGCLAAGLDPARVAALGGGDARAARPLAPLLRGAGRGGAGAALPWRPAPRQSLPVGGPADALRRAGIRRGAGAHRHRLRPRLPADGPGRAGWSRRREPGAEPRAGAQRRCRAARPRCRFWLSLRALVRAHVEPRARPRPACPTWSRPRRYLRPAPARLVAVGGLQGTGKTCLARALAPALGAAPGALLLRTRRDPQAPRRRARRRQRLPAAAYPPRPRARPCMPRCSPPRAARWRRAMRWCWTPPSSTPRCARRRRPRPAGAPFAGFWLAGADRGAARAHRGAAAAGLARPNGAMHRTRRWRCWSAPAGRSRAARRLDSAGRRGRPAASLRASRWP